MKRSIWACGVLAVGLCLAGCAAEDASSKPTKTTATAAASAAETCDCCAEDATATTDAAKAVTVAVADAPKPAEAPKAGDAPKPADAKDQKWTVLFDGKSLDDWKTTPFGGADDISLEDGEMIIPAGATLSGANYTKPTPAINYEVELVGRRRSGSDFWCALTVPAGGPEGDRKYVSLILGGWGGSVCGISSIDGMDASENSTTSGQTFKKNQFYTARLRVAESRIQAWLDNEQILDVDTTDKRLGIRIEVGKSKPFGIATWMTEAGIKSVKVRELTKDEATEKKKD